MLLNYELLQIDRSTTTVLNWCNCFPLYFHAITSYHELLWKIYREFSLNYVCTKDVVIYELGKTHTSKRIEFVQQQQHHKKNFYFVFHLMKYFHWIPFVVMRSTVIKLFTWRCFHQWKPKMEVICDERITQMAKTMSGLMVHHWTQREQTLNNGKIYVRCLLRHSAEKLNSKCPHWCRYISWWLYGFCHCSTFK